MKKPNIDWQKEFEDFSKSGLSQPQYCKEKGIKYTTFRYHWERRLKKQDKDGFVEVPHSALNVSSASGSEFLTLKIDSSGKAHLQMNLQFSLGIWS
ncbi:hypothetical protein FH581_022720 (plasmid) [Leptospira weilii]|uniref:IS66 family insertion sequence element accessory protein TnpA n=1 Tax=Leptospira weilii TaxID=28184 RepID=UPI001EF26F85|nr:hypothetical protein [Leptospira weilii]ULH26863.1 hypothetical protein FH586_01230 [Leptospira weilii]ULH27327.1 hypothetical protein FH586_12905 [Leptospira weilii]ULH27447.1 hypothetical protein FH586_13595 [Leptospira weilii]ULH27455.1 hypothetical protein FH586_13635 [Leptospira weilii]ULH27595.1 hypothetical protein FH586_14430 [Leptospira weilii]